MSLCLLCFAGNFPWSHISSFPVCSFLVDFLFICFYFLVESKNPVVGIFDHVSDDFRWKSANRIISTVKTKILKGLVVYKVHFEHMIFCQYWAFVFNL